MPGKYFSDAQIVQKYPDDVTKGYKEYHDCRKAIQKRKQKISLNHQTQTMILISHTMHSFKGLCWMMKCLTKLQRQSLQIKIINMPSNMMHATNATSATKMLK
ncbi:Hypothetical_protein [Hexamita inflata]|uniref:Hypothetical_protein n=1 Tax=Hexamita inflata TaxID=28002 RepID=A0AA86PJ11_9EUKA|nr:Hypothetical protein HINF_LOCUS27013 [Hexamita inflata]